MTDGDRTAPGAAGRASSDSYIHQDYHHDCLIAAVTAVTAAACRARWP